MLQRSYAINCLNRSARLKGYAIRHVCLQSTRQCQYSSTAPTSPQAQKDIAVIGGGITGLSTAYWLTKKLPNARISLYEAGSRLGGWLHSSEIEGDFGKVLFEHGPRTLRGGSINADITLNMIKDLGLKDEVIFTPKGVPASRNRYIYYPDRLVRLPAPGDSFWGAVWNVIREPLFSGLATGILQEGVTDARNPRLSDESVGSFMSRRLGRQPTDNLVSAMLHGIYAGDVWQLSMKSLFPMGWAFEELDGSIMNGALKSASNGFLFDTRQLDLAKKIERLDWGLKKKDDFYASYKKSSVFSFKKGLQQFNDALERYLRNQPNVSIHLNTKVQELQLEGPGGKMKLTTPKDGTSTKDLVVSSIFSKSLAKICTDADDKKTRLPSLLSTHAVTVMVVNLFFASKDVPKPEGFGYLIPRSVPFEQNPERALGVIFDTDAVQGQDTAAGTKLTVMMGGHYWDGWSGYPTTEEATSMAVDLLRRHLGKIPEPAATVATLQQECIPQYTVGHSERMKQADRELSAKFRGSLRVAGNSYDGVGVHDCTKAAFEVTEGIDDWWAGRSDAKTGLDDFRKDTEWKRVKPADFREGNY